jgi:hypothetical protein
MNRTGKGAAFATAVTALTLTFGPAAACADSFGGRACAAVVQTLSGTTRYCDTGALASAGGSLSASLQAISTATLASGPSSCNTQGSGGDATSVSSMADVSVYAGLAAVLTASLVSSTTDVSCESATGSSTINGLVFAGAAVNVTGAANQTVSVPAVGTLVINEHVQGGASAITVNALHLTLVSGEDLLLGCTQSEHICTVPTRQTTWGQVKSLYR